MRKINTEGRNNNTFTVPEHIAIIMDGNGRWAKKRGLPRNEGHRAGANNLKKIAAAADELGVKYLTVYAFSTENWKRPEKEVNGLMSLMRSFFKNADNDLKNSNIRIIAIGRSDRLDDDIKNEIKRIEEKTKGRNGLNLIIAIDYGGREEIISAAKKIAEKAAQNRLDIESIDEKMFEKNMYMPKLPDPDIIIRPSGEKRLSNFMLWQAAYAELFYMDILWPDFRKKHMVEVLKEYQKRKRRFGGV